MEVKQTDNVQAKVSWCKLEAAVEKMEHVSVIRTDNDLEPPPVSVATVSLKVYCPLAFCFMVLNQIMII